MAEPCLYLMDWEITFFDSNTTIREQLSSTPYVRHYMQEESLAGHAQGEKIELPFNHLINQIVSELSIMNKTIANNSKLTTSLLENGKDILHKKRQYFQQFCFENAIIGDTLALLPPQARSIFEYSVMALSNLILKLSINMAKISIVVVSRFLMPSYLNLFTVALLFEKYLELQLVKGKNFPTAEEHKHFLKQFPKISVIRISKHRKPYDLEFITRSQAKFNQYKPSFYNKIPQEKEKFEVCNLQLIEFYQQQEDNSIFLTNRTPRKFPRHDAFNLSQNFGITAPFGFQLFHLVSELAVTKMVDFKPDIILYIQDMEQEPLIDAKVRGLIVNLLSQKVQHKIYVLREFGVTQNMKKQWLENHGQQQIPEFSPEFSEKMSGILSQKTIDSTFVDQSDRFASERRISIDAYIRQNMTITFDYFKKLQNYYKNVYMKGSFLSNFNTVSTKDKKENDFQEKLKKLHKNALEDLNYLSLALIQKSNFEQTITAYHNYVFPLDFLDKTIIWLNKQIDLIDGQRSSIQVYRSKLQKLRGMRHLSNYLKSSLQINQTKFFNFITGKEEPIKCIDPVTKYPRSLHIAKQDSFYVAYVQSFVILFLFGQIGYGIYRKNRDQTLFNVVRQQNYNEQTIGLSKKYSACVANKKFFYKAFGEAKDRNQYQQSQIYRIQIERPEHLEKKDWVKVATHCFANTNNGKTVLPLQKKRHGFGFSYDTQQKQKKVNIVIFGGGYNFNIQNQQKINRYFYIIRDNTNQVYKIGKTNDKLVNQSQNMRKKTLIYPFVYGIPLFSSPTDFTILNTNGYLQNINNFKKLFLTKVRSGPLVANLNSIGIIAQNKLDYQSQSPEIAMANKNTILASLINSYHRVNRMGNKVALYNSEGQILIMELSKATEADKFDIVTVSPVNSTQMSENEDSLKLYFPSKQMILK